MKILFSNYDDIKNPYYGGGGAFAIHEVAKRLAKKHLVKVVTGSYPNAKDEIIDDVFYKRIGPSLVGPRIGQILYHLFLPIFIRKEEFDILFESFTPPHSTSFTPIFTRKPVVGIAHMLASEDMQRKYKLPFGLVEKIGLKFYKDIIVVNPEIKKDILKANLKARVKVIPNGVDIPKKRKVNSKKEHILFIGRVEVNQKGLDLLLEAFRKVLSSKTKIRLVIAGGGLEKEIKSLKKQVSLLSLNKKVKILGRVEGALKQKIFEKAFFVVIPSRFETFSRVALEACSFSLPVLCFDIKGLKWLPKSLSLKVRPFDVDELSKGILKLYSDKKLRKKLSRGAFEFSKKFNWEEISKEYEEYVYKFYPFSRKERNFEKVLKRIISGKKECFFISPHLDDAIFSVGGIISYLAGRTNVYIINVFTKASRGPYTLSARRAILGKAKDAQDLYRIRKIEDKRVFESLGVKSLNLGFTEALYRRTNIRKLKKLTMFLGKVFPEFLFLYPTYWFHINRGKIHQEDNELIEKISKKLRKLIPKRKKVLIFCPLADNSHVDHLLVKEAVCRNFKNVWFWQDLPYLAGKEFEISQKFSGSRYLFRVHPEVKKPLISFYRSQLPKSLEKMKCELFMNENVWIDSKKNL